MEPTLYIIIREDLCDNSPGKMMAQAAHAQADFTKWYTQELDSNEIKEEPLVSAVLAWCGDRNFGRTLVVSGTHDDIKRAKRIAKYAGETVDPTYPWRNYYGKMFVSNEVTCGWVFVPDVECREYEFMREFPLHP